MALIPSQVSMIRGRLRIAEREGALRDAPIEIRMANESARPVASAVARRGAFTANLPEGIESADLDVCVCDPVGGRVVHCQSVRATGSPLRYVTIEVPAEAARSSGLLVEPKSVAEVLSQPQQREAEIRRWLRQTAVTTDAERRAKTAFDGFRPSELPADFRARRNFLDVSAPNRRQDLIDKLKSIRDSALNEVADGDSAANEPQRLKKRCRTRVTPSVLEALNEHGGPVPVAQLRPAQDHADATAALKATLPIAQKRQRSRDALTQELLTELVRRGQALNRIRRGGGEQTDA